MQALDTRGAGRLRQQQGSQPVALRRIEQSPFLEQLLDHPLLLHILQPGDGKPLGIDAGRIGNLGKDGFDQPDTMGFDCLRPCRELGQEILFRCMPLLRLRRAQAEVAGQPRKIVGHQPAVSSRPEHAGVNEQGKISTMRNS